MSAFEWDKRDKRLDKFPMMESIWPIVIICSMYLFLSTVVGPWIMSSRKPINLNGIMIAHNIVEIFGCTYIKCVGFHIYYYLGYNISKNDF